MAAESNTFMCLGMHIKKLNTFVEAGTHCDPPIQVTYYIIVCLLQNSCLLITYLLPIKIWQMGLKYLASANSNHAFSGYND